MVHYDEIVCYGGAGHAMVMLHAGEHYWNGKVKLRAVVDDRHNGMIHPQLGVPVISAQDRLESYADVPVFMGMGSPSACARIGARLRGEGATFASVPGRPELVHPTVKLGEGVLVAPHTRIGPNVEVGDFCQLLGDLIAHDVIIGDACHLGVHSSVLGNVTIGAQTNIAPHAVICNGAPGAPLTIGSGATVAVGAVVSRDLPDGSKVIGNPAMPVEDWARLKALIADQ